MDALAGDVAQRAIDHALALQPRDADEGGAFDLHGEMRFVGAVVAHVAAMAGAVVDDLHPGGREGLGEESGDFLGYWSCHIFPSSRSVAIWHPVRHDRFHGRHQTRGKACDWPQCAEAGEFRAPGPRSSGFDGPGDYRWFCLDHVRSFNAGYDYFAGMSAEEILAAQSPLHGWAQESRAFSPTAGVDSAPRWADFSDPLDAISKRARSHMNARRPAERQDGRIVTVEERRALDVLGLPLDADRKALRGRYSELVRQYHPDRNGGDRSFEARLQAVVEAYQLLRKAAAFA